MLLERKARWQCGDLTLQQIGLNCTDKRSRNQTCFEIIIGQFALIWDKAGGFR